VTAPGYQVPSNLYRDPTGVVGTRTLAWIVDFLLYVGLMLLVSAPFSPLAEKADVPEGMTDDDVCEQLAEVEDATTAGCLVLGDTVYWTDDTDQIIQGAVSLSWFVIVFVILQGLKGVTPGKALTGLRVVREDGQPPGIGRALLRSLLWIVDGQPCGIPLVGFICVLSSPGHRRVGDLAAKTYVVDKADAGRPIRLPGMPAAPAPMPGYGVSPPGGVGAPGYPTAQGATWGTTPPATGSGPAWPSSPPTAPTPTTPGPPATSPQPQTPSTWGTWGETRPEPPSSGETSPGTPATDSFATPATSDVAPTEGASSGPARSDPDAAPTAEPGAGAATAPAPGPDTGAGSTPSTEPSPGSGTSDVPASGGTAGTVSDASATSTYKPQWDAARNTYIQWDPNRGHWLQWDDTAKQWKQL
jgi:RDD family